MKIARGFTLIELLTAIAVVGILAAVTVMILDPPSFYGRGRDAERQSDLQAIKAALEQFYLDNGREYPATIGANLNDYLKDPDALTDPQGTSYAAGYSVSGDSKCYQLSASLESETDPLEVCGGSLTCQNNNSYCQP